MSKKKVIRQGELGQNIKNQGKTRTKLGQNKKFEKTSKSKRKSYNRIKLGENIKNKKFEKTSKSKRKSYNRIKLGQNMEKKPKVPNMKNVK